MLYIVCCLCSQEWFDDFVYVDMIVFYVECFMNYGLMCEELQLGCFVIGIVQMGSDLVLCNCYYFELVEWIKVGICDVGGILMEFFVYLLVE